MFRGEIVEPDLEVAGAVVEVIIVVGAPEIQAIFTNAQIVVGYEALNCGLGHDPPPRHRYKRPRLRRNDLSRWLLQSLEGCPSLRFLWSSEVL